MSLPASSSVFPASRRLPPLAPRSNFCSISFAFTFVPWTVLHDLLAGALRNGSGLVPTPALIEELVEDLESLDSIIAMGQSQERVSFSQGNVGAERDLREELTRFCLARARRSPMTYSRSVARLFLSDFRS